MACFLMATQPNRFGFDNLSYKPIVPVVQAQVSERIPLNALANKLGVDRELLEELNSGLIQNITPPNTDYLLKVPSDSIVRVAGLSQADMQGMQVARLEYTVRPGDNISSIAQRLETAPENIFLPKGRSPHLVFPGEKLSVILR
jgi:hypothetical protein